MEYALEGHGYCRSRALRDLPSWKDLPLERRVHLDAHLEQLALHGNAGGWARAVEAPPDLLDALHVRAPSSPRAALALDVAASVKEVFDGLARTHVLRISHCTIEEGAPEAAHLVLGAWSPTIAAEVARAATRSRPASSSRSGATAAAALASTCSPASSARSARTAPWST